MAVWQGMYWSAAKIDSRTAGTLALAIFNRNIFLQDVYFHF